MLRTKLKYFRLFLVSSGMKNQPFNPFVSNADLYQNVFLMASVVGLNSQLPNIVGLSTYKRIFDISSNVWSELLNSLYSLYARRISTPEEYSVFTIFFKC